MNIFEGFEGAKIFYTDRFDGNFADYVGDDPALVSANRARLSGELAANIVILKQVHGDTILEFDGAKFDGDGWLLFGDGDGVVSNQRGVYLAIQTADCAPVAVYDRTNKAVAALHAGRKGAELNILQKCVELMRVKYGTNPKDLYLFIGVCISGRSYELPKDTADLFVEYDGAVKESEGAYFLDIKTVLLSQAEAAGIGRQNIITRPECSSAANDTYFSYRAEDGKCGRMLTGIAVFG